MIARYADKNDILKFRIIKREFCKDYGIKKLSDEFIDSEFYKFLERCIIILEDDGKFTGYILGSIETDDYETYGYIWEIFISKEQRSKGHSSILKDEFLKYLKKNNITLCRLDVSPSRQAVKVYERWGFKVDKYRMTLEL